MIIENLFENNNVIVYKDMFKNVELITKAIKDSEQQDESGPVFEDWEAWFHFGTQVGMPFKPYVSYEDLMSNDIVHEYRDIKDGEHPQEYVQSMLTNAFYVASKDFLSKNKIDIPNWRSMGIAVCKYNRDGKDYAMAYHTDYSRYVEQEPGFKFTVTACLYLNDDYIGGELNLLDIDTKQVIQYTPNAGDVVIFLSDEPIYHGVGKIYEGDKYFCRLFWGWDSEGSDEWNFNKNKYGEDVWKKMEGARIKKEFWDGKYHKDVVWNEKELNDERYSFSDEHPRIDPVFSPFPMIKKGKIK